MAIQANLVKQKEGERLCPTRPSGMRQSSVTAVPTAVPRFPEQIVLTGSCFPCGGTFPRDEGVCVSSLSEAMGGLSWSRCSALGYELQAGLELSCSGDFGPGVRLISVLDHEYPINLLRCKQRPAGLYVRGLVLPVDARAVAVVGTRSPSREGLARARRLGRVLAQAGVTVVSGLARGVDTAAHDSCLRAGGRTLAVLGHGLGHCYPPENADLAEGIAAQGAVLSQFAPDFAPTRWSFPERNRLIAGLSLVSVAVECSERSGTLSELKAAQALGRRVFLLESLVSACCWAREWVDAGRAEVLRSEEQLLGVC